MRSPGCKHTGELCSGRVSKEAAGAGAEGVEEQGALPTNPERRSWSRKVTG